MPAVPNTPSTIARAARAASRFAKLRAVGDDPPLEGHAGGPGPAHAVLVHGCPDRGDECEAGSEVAGDPVLADEQEQDRRDPADRIEPGALLANFEIVIG